MGNPFGPRPALAPRVFPWGINLPARRSPLTPIDGVAASVGRRALGRAGVPFSHPTARARPVDLAPWSIKFLASAPPDTTTFCRQAGAGPRALATTHTLRPVLARQQPPLCGIRLPAQPSSLMPPEGGVSG